MTTGESHAPVDLLAIGETMALFTPVHERTMHAGGLCRAGAAGAETNVARLLALLGRRAAWVGAVGVDAMGDLVMEALALDGVGTDLVVRNPDHPTGVMFKSAQAGTRGVEYRRRGSAGSRIGLPEAATVREVPAAIVHITGVTCAISASCAALVADLLAGPRFGPVMSFDVNYRPSLWPEAPSEQFLGLARRADVVFVGQDEAQELWGCETAADVRDLIPEPTTLVVKDGAREATQFRDGEAWVVPAPQREVTEPVGAGDAFAAGWLLGLLSGRAPEVQLLLGHECAALVLRTEMDTPMAEDLAPVLELLAKQPLA